MDQDQSSKFNILSFSTPKIRILHLTWLAFFISFFVWFNHAPFKESILATLKLTEQEWKTLLIMNVALTIPARIIIGMLVDKLGPKITFSVLLFTGGVLCFPFALATDFYTMAISRFMLGFVGAGFVIGIRMVGEWFPAKQVGVAEGIYGGWGNFGSAFGLFTLPTIGIFFVSMYGGQESWRYAVMFTGIIALTYSVIYYFSVSDTPKGSTYFKPKKAGAMEVTSVGDFILYIIMLAPLFLALGVLNWKLGPENLKMLPALASYLIYAGLALIYFYQVYHAYKVNKSVFSEPVDEIHRYKFKQVAVLDMAYLVTFGSELAVVSMLAAFFNSIFGLTEVVAGMLAASYAFMNLLARPGGGWISDTFGRRKTLIILLIGLILGYLAMSQISSLKDYVQNPYLLITFAVMITMFCSFFVQAGEGAVFAMVPIIKRRMTGQIAGMVGAYGNIGAVVFLTVYSFVSPEVFFLTIAATGIVTLIGVYLFLDEPSGQMAEVLPDGTVQMIDVT
ncbi:MAG: NarK family nitrate/nitrite MFS transporter [Methyloligellaceae bacterium]